MSLRQQVRDLQLQLGIEAKKSLGQNFLISDHVVGRIIAEALRDNPSSVIEIGPGLGSLTNSLLNWKNAQEPRQLQLLELDRVFCDYWRTKGVALIEADALNVDWKVLTAAPRPLILVSNLPYQISSRIVIDRCLDENRVDGMILMFQKEVAQRIQARQEASVYGFLSVMAQTFWEVSTVCEAGPGDFEPPPKIASRVLRFRKKIVRVDAEKYLTFLKAAFSHPRKLLAGNLGSLREGIRAEAEQWLTENKLSLKSRAEELRVEDFLSLAQKLGYL